MILLNGEKITDGSFAQPPHKGGVLSYFPDHTSHIRIANCDPSCVHIIRWHYQCDAEMAVVYFITQHLHSYGCTVTLELPYIPNARMDRSPDQHEVFTLKHFAKFINDLHFQQVVVLDPHSSVSDALFERLVHISPVEFIEKTVRDLNLNNLIAFYPDEGSMKRYSGMIKMPYAFGIKKRDWQTGEIKSYDIVQESVVHGSHVLIIDDICSAGGTFYHAANALRTAGAKSIFLHVTHCESLACKHKLLDSGLIQHIYTTNSIFSDADPAFTVWEV